MPGVQVHVGQRALAPPAARPAVPQRGRVGHHVVDGHRLGRVGAPGDGGPQRAASIADLVVELGAVVGGQSCASRPAPAPSPRRLGRAVRPSRYAKVVSSGAIIPARAPPSMDMLQTVIRPSIDSARMAVAAVLDDRADAAADAERPDDAEHQVLGGAAGRQVAVDGDRHGLRLDLAQRLGGQHVLDLGGADAERQRAERAVGGGVAVAADDRHARLGEPELRADHVHDALVDAAERVQRDRRGSAQLRLEPRDLLRGQRVGDRLVQARSSARRGPSWRPSGRAGGPCGPASSRPSKACGEVTSCTRCRSM